MFEISLRSSQVLIHLDSERVLGPACQTVAVIKYLLPFFGELYRIRDEVEVQLRRAPWFSIPQVLFVCFSITQLVSDFIDKRLILLLFWGLICFVCFIQLGDLNGPQVRDTLGTKLSFMLHIIQALKLKVIESLLIETKIEYFYFKFKCLYKHDASGLCWFIIYMIWRVPWWLQQNPFHYISLWEKNAAHNSFLSYAITLLMLFSVMILGNAIS